MSTDNDISALVKDAEGESFKKGERDVDLALQAVSKLLNVTGDTFNTICTAVEEALSKDQLKTALGRFNAVLRIFGDAFPEAEYEKMVLDAVKELNPSARFSAYLLTAASVRDATTSWKTAIMQDLAVFIRQKELQARREEVLDEELFARFLPEPVSPESEVETFPDEVFSIPKAPVSGSGDRKRGVSLITESASIPKKSKIPALASISQVVGETSTAASVKKVLETREKLRAGLDDPKGLLNLVDSSTAALERTKRLELLKSAGHVFAPQSNKLSFVDKLNAAILRLELGLGAQSPADSLIFGNKVLSSPGFLSPKHISNIENNWVEGKTTWKHQHHYCRSMIAGCINQAKRIISMYDEVLFGPAPESLVTGSHQAIRDLLLSDEGKKFMTVSQEEDGVMVTFCDNFVKKVVGAISPILPIVLRNKALDGGYLRTALNLIGCAEFLFTQYQTDIRDHANPNGVVGLSSGMHMEFKQSAVFGTELAPLEVFMADMRGQYQTSLGLGAPFPKDTGTRGGRSGFRRGRGRGRNWSRFPAQNSAQYTGNSANDRRSVFSPPAGGSGQAANFVTMRNQGLCFAFQNGNCNRGRSCRFRHLNPAGAV